MQSKRSGALNIAGGSRGGRGGGNLNNAGKGRERFVIKVDTITKGKEKRTTLMIQNIPNKYSRQMLVDELTRNPHCCSLETTRTSAGVGGGGLACECLRC